MVISKQRVGQAISVGPIPLGLGHNVILVSRLHKFGGTDFGNKQTESWSSKLGGTEIIATGNREFASPSR